MRTVLSTGLVLIGVVLGGAEASAVVTQSGADAATKSDSQDAGHDGRVDLNQADQAELETLPGVGPRTAELIIEYRDDNGRFQKIEDLMNVRGIGERTFLRLRDLVRVSADPSR